jgi:hypothetical protein
MLSSQLSSQSPVESKELYCASLIKALWIKISEKLDAYIHVSESCQIDFLSC